LFRYAELVRILTIKEFRLRYQNSALGFLWSILNPLLMMIVLWLVFAVFIGSSARNYPVFILPTLLVWRYFTVSTTSALWSVIGNSSLVTRVYFPRWLLVLSSNLANLLGSSLEFAVLFPLLILLGMKVQWTILLVPVLLAVEFILIMGISLLISPLNVRYRDMAQVWDITLQVGFYFSPILFDVTVIPQRYVPVFFLNPLAGLLVAIRQILYYNSLPSSTYLLLTAIAGGVLLLAGSLVFRQFEPRLAEEV